MTLSSVLPLSSRLQSSHIFENRCELVKTRISLDWLAEFCQLLCWWVRERERVSDARHRTSILLWKIYRAMLCWDTLTYEMSKFVDIQQYFFKSVLFPIYPPMNITVISRSSCLLALWRLYLWWNSTHSQTRVRIYLHARTHEVMYAPLHACTCENTCTYVRSTLQTESLT